MHCYECFEASVERDAVALCHHCSAALCAHHAIVVSDPVMAVEPLFKTVELPKHARLMFCVTCWEALTQRTAVRNQYRSSEGAADNGQEESAVPVHG